MPHFTPDEVRRFLAVSPAARASAAAVDPAKVAEITELLNLEPHPRRRGSAAAFKATWDRFNGISA